MAGVQDRNGTAYYIVYDPNYTASNANGRFTNKEAVIDGGNGRLIIKQDSLNREITFSGVVSK